MLFTTRLQTLCRDSSHLVCADIFKSIDFKETHLQQSWEQNSVVISTEQVQEDQLAQQGQQAVCLQGEGEHGVH